MREFFFQLRKRMRMRLRLATRQLRRLFTRTKLDEATSYSIPIIINNRNRVTYTRDLVNWLKNAGYNNIYILDNASTYPPLLEYYKSTPARVIRLKENRGYMALWQIPFFYEVCGGYYVYTDPDVLPGPACPRDIVYRLYAALKRHPLAEKCGPALRIDDLPAHYDNRAKVLALERAHWDKKIEDDVFDAPIDTTFALYRPFAAGNAEECRAIRVAGDCVFIHRPWYERSSEPDEESRFYKENVSSSSYWYTR